MSSYGWVLPSEGGVFLRARTEEGRSATVREEERESEGGEGTNEKIGSKTGVDSTQEL